MAKFIKLTDPDERPVYVNADQILYFKRSANDTLTFVQFADGDEYDDVTETPEQILALIEASNA